MTEDDVWDKVRSETKPLKKKDRLPVIVQHPTRVQLRERVERNHRPHFDETVRLQVSVGRLVKADYKNVSLDARLDLHGYTLLRAEEKLLHFLQVAQHIQNRWVLIITGKGGVLKEEVPRLLDRAAAYVIAYGHALPKDGGDGAFYVRVRRIR